MPSTQERTPTPIGAETPASQPNRSIPKIDPNAPAGSKTSLGAESVRDGRPSTGSEVVEAMDEEGPGIDESNATDI